MEGVVGMFSAFVTLLVGKHSRTTTTRCQHSKQVVDAQNQPHWLGPLADVIQILKYTYEHLYSPEIASSIFLLAPKVVIPSSFRS